jgi:DNA polymerase-3 subunit alpha
MKFKPMACGFHSHTDYSLDGGSNTTSKILRASELGRIADCVTDHGIMSALVSHWVASEKLHKDKKTSNRIQSIHGIEAYVIDDYRPPKEYKNGKKEPQYYHLTIHFKTAKAYQYFCELTPIMESRSIVKYGEPKPLMTLKELEPIASEITIGSGCVGGPVGKNVLAGKSYIAEELYVKLRNLVGKGNFFVEVMPHAVDKNWQKPVRDDSGKIIKPGEFIPALLRRDADATDPDPDPCKAGVDMQKIVNQFSLYLAKKYNDPVLISLDDHFAAPDDKVVQETRLGNGIENWKFYGTYASFSSDECAELLQNQLSVSDKEIESWIDNSYLFVEQFKNYKLETSKDRWLLPTTEMVYNIKEDSKKKLYELIKHHGKMPKETDKLYQVYKERLEYEVSVLSDNGVADFLPYFFVLEDAARWAKENNVMYNVRGSGGGCLVLFLLNVSITDPIFYDLPFERFLTIGRILSGNLPDIDSDWEDREKICAYLRQKYGNQVALIATDVLMRLKVSIMDTERAELGIVRPETAKMCKNMGAAPQGVSDKDWLFGYTDKTTGEHISGFWDQPESEVLRKYSEDNPKIWETVQKCIGIVKNRGVHAGGLIITPGPVHRYMPLVSTGQGLATAYNMKHGEYVGGVKYDFLGVSTLKALSLTIAEIKKDFGVDLKWKEFPYDQNVYKNIIEKDKLAGIFQINTRLVRPYVRDIKPRTTREIALVTSLCRPGALDAPSPDPSDPETETAATYYVQCAQGNRKPYFIHDDLKSVLGETFGVIVTQEQALKLFRVFAEYSYETAEEVRRAIGKKDKDLLSKHSLVLKQKCMEKGWTAEQAERLFTSIEASARYSFNMAHAASYAIVAYNGCYLKHHYPLHFWKGELSINTDDFDALQEYMSECKHLLLPVDIIKSHPTEWTIEGKKIRPPLSLLKGCGEKQTTILRNFIETPLHLFGGDE